LRGLLTWLASLDNSDYILMVFVMQGPAED